MTSRSLLLSVLALAACQAPTASGAFRDAAFSRGAPVAEVPPRVLDDIAAELLRAAIAVQTVEQRVRCENIANVDTVGYKRRIVHTTTEQVVGQEGDSFTLPTVVTVSSVFTTGRLELTERCLDVAIDGEGLFAVLRPDGSTGYTRDGRLTVNADGKLMAGQSGQLAGHPGPVLLPEITIPSDTLELSIDPTGLVGGRTAGSPTTMTIFGQLTLHRFVNPAGMCAEASLWRPGEASGAPITGQPGLHGLGLLKQGFLERSNVELAKELLALQMLEKKRDALLAVMRQFGLVAP